MLMRLCDRLLSAVALFGFMALGSGCALPRRAAPRPPTALSAQGSLLIADGDFARDPRAVDAAGALRDLDVALRVFEEAYAGPEGQPRSPDAAAVALARRRLASRGSMTARELTEELRALFARPDGHLAFGYGGSSPLRLTASPALDAAAGVSAIDGSSAPFTGSDGALRSPSSQGASAAPSPPGEGAPAVSLTEGRVPVLAIRTFDSARERELSGLPAIAARLRRARAFVVDLRGNHGGNFAFAMDFVLALTDRTLLRLGEREVLSPAAAEGRANSARRRLAEGDVPASAERVFQGHIAALTAEARALREAGRGRDEIVTRGAVVKGRARGPLEGRGVLLVDRGCASACEMMLALARQIPGVVVAGENTFGGMAVGEVALFRLPASGVTISLGTRAFTDPLGDFREMRGFLPDVRLASEDPLTEARALAASGRGRMSSARAGFRH